MACLSSRGDTQEYADLNKLARRFLKGSLSVLDEGNSNAPSRAYVQEVMEELRKGEVGECPICLEAFEDAVLTSCAHRLCRECLLASWHNSNSGLCPVCRYFGKAHAIYRSLIIIFSFLLRVLSYFKSAF